MNLAVPLSAGPFSLEEYQLRSITNAIKAAWSNLKTMDFDVLKDEDKTTIKLLELLGAIRKKGNVPGFTANNFELPSRDSKIKNYNGESIDKMPDITIRPTGGGPGLNDYEWGLFIESKLLCDTKPIRLYVGEGIARFVNGDYAYRMTHSLMLGYTDTAHTLPNDLNFFFNPNRKGRAQCAIDYCPQGETCCSSTFDSSIFVTIHHRSFQQTPLPGEISIHHLWLR